MPELRTKALVLRAFDFGESDRLVHLYAEQLGRVSAIAKGAKRSKRRFPGTLEILTVVDVRIVDPPRSSLMRLEGAKLVEPFEGLANDVVRFGIACLLCELLDRATGDRQAHPELFRFVIGALGTLRTEVPDRLLALLVTAKTLAWLGYRPQLLRCSVCTTELPASGRVVFDPSHGGAVCRTCRTEGVGVPVGVLRALERGIRTPLRERSALSLAESEVRVAERLLGTFLAFHLGFELRSSGFLAGALDSSGFGQAEPGNRRYAGRRESEPALRAMADDPPTDA